MARFKRIKTRDNEFGETFKEPEWQKGYEFESRDFSPDPGVSVDTTGQVSVEIGYAIDVSTGKLHAWASIEQISGD